MKLLESPWRDAEARGGIHCFTRVFLGLLRGKYSSSLPTANLPEFVWLILRQRALRKRHLRRSPQAEA